jgi:arylsulfatase A-like enzyme
MLNTHIKPAWSPGLSPEIPTFGKILNESGYSLDYVGKWHVHRQLGPEDFGFHRFVMPKCPYKGHNVDPKTRIDIEFIRGRQLVAGTNLLPKEKVEGWQVTDRAIGLLRERAERGKPFLLRIDLQEPHFENIVPEPYASMYDPSTIPPWPNFDETFEGKPASHLRKHQEWHLEDKDWSWWSKVVAKYYGDISLLDSHVGRVLKAIEETGIEDNTIFMFSTDHADSMGSHKHFEKAGTMYDEVYKIPLLIKAPSAWAGSRVVNSFVRLLDLMPTIVDLAGAQLPRSVDGMSLVPLLKGEQPERWPDSVYCEHHGEVWGYQSQRMVRTHGWKYVYNPTDLDELYDLESDPFEMINCISDAACSSVLDEMKARLIGWNDSTEDMFRWNWVKWNFPDPVFPMDADASVLPLTFIGNIG